MTANETIKLNQIIGKALTETAHEAYLNRITAMKSRPFDEVITAIKNKNKTGQNKANGYFVTDAIRYLDERLEKEDVETWSEIEDTTDNDWFEAIEQFRW